LCGFFVFLVGGCGVGVLCGGFLVLGFVWFGGGVGCGGLFCLWVGWGLGVVFLGFVWCGVFWGVVVVIMFGFCVFCGWGGWWGFWFFGFWGFFGFVCLGFCVNLELCLGGGGEFSRCSWDAGRGKKRASCFCPRYLKMVSSPSRGPKGKFVGENHTSNNIWGGTEPDRRRDKNET